MGHYSDDPTVLELIFSPFINAVADIVELIKTIVTTPEYLIYTLVIIGIGVAVIWYKKEGQAKKDQFKNKRKRRG